MSALDISLDDLEVQKTTIAKKQSDLLDSFINMKQYDKLLFYLESNLFTNAPKLDCPSPFILRIVLSLATVGYYNNADNIRKEFDRTLTEQHLHIRAANILKRLINIVRNNSKTNNDDPFAPEKFDQDSVANAEEQLIRTLDFFREDRFKILRSRTLKKDYRDNKRRRLDSFLSQEDTASTGDDNKDPESEWSPQKRALEREFARLQDEQKQEAGQDSDSDSDSDFFHGTADKMSLKIFKNDRIDFLLGGERIWGVISWALSCGSSNKPVHREAFKVWESVLEIIIDIIDLELNKFISLKNERDHNDFSDSSDSYPLFKDTTASRFLLKVGRYSFPKRVTEFIFTKYDPKLNQVLDNELTVAKSVHLPKEIIPQSKALIVTEETSSLRRKLFFLIARAASQVDIDDPIGIRQSKEGLLSDLVTEMKYTLTNHLNYDDLINFFRLTKEDFESEWKLITVTDLMVCHLVQLTTYSFHDTLDGLGQEWMLKEDSLGFIEELFENVTFDKKYYGNGEALDFEKIKMDFSKMSIILFDLFNIWLISSGAALTKKQITNLVRLAKIGEKERIDVIESCKREYDDEELQYLSIFLEKWLET